MSNGQLVQKTRRRRRKFPFYKVQLFDIGLGTWKDEHRTFDTTEDAKAYIKRNKISQDTRLVRIEEKSRQVLNPSST
jgi:hypothetical protein